MPTGTGTDRPLSVSGMMLAGVVVLLPLLSRNVLDGKLFVIPAIAIVLTAALGVYGMTRIHPVGSRWDRDPALLLALTVPLSMALSAIVHQLVDAWLAVAFAASAAMLTLIIRDMTRAEIRIYVAYPLLATAALQALLAAAQLATGEPVLPTWFAANIRVLVIDGVARPQGTMRHVYQLGALGLLAIGAWIAVREPRGRIPVPVVSGLALSTAMITITFSRSALLGLLAIIAAMVISGFRGDRSSYTVAAVLASVFLVVAMLTASSWATRADQSTDPNLDDASLGRLTLTRQAFTLIGENPLFGVGPTRFVQEVRRHDLIDEQHPFVVHNYPLAVAAENGILDGVIVTALLVWLGIAAIRAGPGTSATYLGLLPLLLFDVLHYLYPSPQLMFGIWLGVLSAAMRWRTDDRTQTSRRIRSA